MLNKFRFTPSSHLYPASHTESVWPYRPTFSSAHYPSTTPFCFFSTLFPFLFCNLTRCLSTAIPAYSVYCVPSFAYGFASLSLWTITWYTCFPLFSSFVRGVLLTHRGLLPPFLALWRFALCPRAGLALPWHFVVPLLYLRFSWRLAGLRVGYVCAGTASLLHQANNYWVESECRRFHLFHPFISNHYGSKLLWFFHVNAWWVRLPSL